MKKLIIIGAGAFGLEVWSWLKHAKGYGTDFEFKGFLDSNIKEFGRAHFCNGIILGDPLKYEICEDDVFVCAIGSPTKKREALLKFEQKEAKFINLIHKSVIEFEGITYGKGIILSPKSIVSNCAKVGNHVSVNLFCSIGHDVVIGDYCVLSSHCDLTGRVNIGQDVMIGSRVTVIPKVSIIHGVTIGAGAVVLRDIKINGTYFGNPAKLVI